MKKILSLILAMSLLLSMGVLVSAQSFADTEGKTCEKAVEVLSSLGVIEGREDGSYDPEGSLTRAEMVTILLRVMNVMPTVAADMFSDVSDSHWAYKNIGTAYQVNLVNGTSEVTFSPDEAVSFAQAVKMVVTMLGYKPKAEAAGGYPAGYISTAVTLDLLKGISGAENMNRGIMAMLIYNALDITLFEQTTYGQDNGEYKESNNTILNQYMKVEYYKEVIAASRILETKAIQKELSSDEVCLDSGKVLKTGKADIKNLIGMECEIYTKLSDDETETILYASPVSMAESFTVQTEDIKSLTASAIVYENEKGKMITENLSTASVVYNGRLKSQGNADIKPDMGSVRIIKNDGKNISAVIVEDIVNAVSNGVDLNKNVIHLKNPVSIAGEAVSRIDMDLFGNEDHFLYDKDGNDITLEMLEDGDILSVIQSEDNTLRIVYQCYESVVGKVTEQDTNGNVIINDTEYSVDKNVTDISMGKEGKFCFDYLGNIAAVSYEGISEVKKYGWLVSASAVGGLKKEIGYKIFTDDGEMKTFEGNERLILNDISVDNEDMVKILTGEEDFPAVSANPERNPKIWDKDNSKIIPQLVIYDTDEEGKVLTKLTLAENQTAGTDDERFGGNFSMDFYIPKGGQEAKSWDGNPDGKDTVGEGSGTEFVLGNVFGRVKITDNTKYFVIPKDEDNDRAYSIQTMNKVVTLESFRKLDFISFFDVSDEYVCGAVVRNDYFGGDPVVEYPNDMTIGIISKVSQGIDADGAVVTLFNVYDEYGKENIVTVDETMKCGYRVAASDVKNDPEWYTEIGNREVFGRTDEDRKERNDAIDGPMRTKDGDPTGTSVRNDKVMNIYAGSLEAGDLIGYTLDGSNNFRNCIVVYRSNPEFCGKVSFSDVNGAVKSMKRSKFYVGGYLRIYGTVRSVDSTSTMVDAPIAYSNGEMTGYDNNGVEYDKRKVLYNLPKEGKFVIWDTEKMEMSVASAADIVKGDTILSVWETVTQLLTVIIR